MKLVALAVCILASTLATALANSFDPQMFLWHRFDVLYPASEVRYYSAGSSEPHTIRRFTADGRSALSEGSGWLQHVWNPDERVLTQTGITQLGAGTLTRDSSTYYDERGCMIRSVDNASSRTQEYDPPDLALGHCFPGNYGWEIRFEDSDSILEIAGLAPTRFVSIPLVEQLGYESIQYQVDGTEPISRRKYIFEVDEHGSWIAITTLEWIPALGRYAADGDTSRRVITYF